MARLYEGLIDAFVIDEADADLEAAIRELGLEVLVTRTIMGDKDDRERLAALRRGAAERSAEFLPGNVVARYLEVYAEALARRKGSGAAWTS